MKFNKSCILLIAIAIFLLISIGSVCASENITDNNDIPLADDGTDVVLSDDTDGNVPDDTNTEKINTTVETEKDSYEFKEDSNNKTISVQVKDNKTNQNLDINDSDLSISNGTKPILFEYNSSIITITEKLPTGNYNLTITYKGNATYANSFSVISVKIYGNNTIETETSVISNGKDIEIPVKISDQVDYIKLIEDNFNLTLIYTNETGNPVHKTISDFEIVDGKIKFESPVTLINASLIISYVNATNKTVAIKVSTEIKAETDKDKFESEENKDISITIIDGQGNLLNINKTDLKIFDNGKGRTDFEFNNSNITIELDIGVHNLTIVYVGNDTYATSNITKTLKVWGNQTINPQETADIDSNNKVNITLNLSDGADPVNVNLDNLTVTLFWTINNEKSNRTIESVSLAEDNQTISFEVNEKFESAYVIIEYKAENNLTGKTTLKIATEITATPDDNKIGVGELVNYTVEIKSVNGTNINVTSDNIKILNNGKEVNFTCNNSVITLTDKFTYGIYNLTINYLGTDTYATSTKIIGLTVYGINATTSTNINSTKKGEVKVDVINGNESINITSSDLNITVTYKDGNETKNITSTIDKYENGTLYFTLENGNFTTATLTINYNQTSVNVTLNRIYNIGVEPISVSADYQEGNFTFRIVDVDDDNKPLINKTVSITGKNSENNLIFINYNNDNSFNMNTGTSLTTDENGIITLINKNFYPGYILTTGIFAPADKYNLTISGDGTLLKGSNTTVITINKIDLNIKLENFDEYFGTSKKFTIIVTNAKTGNPISGTTVNFKIVANGNEISYTNTNGEKINSLTTNDEGKIELPASNLLPNEFIITADVANNTNYNDSSMNSIAKINKIPVVINGNDVTVQYNTGTTYTVKVTKNGKAVSGVYLLVRLYTTSSKYNDYLFQTNSKGQVSFSASLAVGKHKIVISSADNRYDAKQVTKTITVKKVSAKITAKKVTTYYKAGKYFTVKLTNTKNKKAVYDGKINIKIFVSKNRYYNYNGNTGMNGQLKLLLDSLKPGTYKVEVSGADNKNFNAKKVTTKIVIKKAPTKFVIQKTAKKSKKYLKITVKNKKTKKVISGVKIKVKVYTGKKSKTYTLKTTSKGIAKLNIKSLKVGKHKVAVTSANKYCTAKKTTKTVKIKK